MGNFKIDSDSDGQRLDQFLAGVEQVGSRSRAQSLISSNKVVVDGRRLGKSHKLRCGEVVAVNFKPEPITIESAEMKLEIPYEDEYLMVVDKPAGLVVHPAPSHRGPTLVNVLIGKGKGGELFRPGIVHRLDKETSGLMVVAKNEQLLRKLQKMIQRRELSRQYKALVEGKLPSIKGTIDAPLGRDIKDRKKISTISGKTRNAITHFEVLEQLQEAALVKVTLETGRTHQIRAHFNAIGHPVIGDPQYGNVTTFKLKRQFLHSSRLSFIHPISGETVEVNSELPEDLARCLNQVRAVDPSHPHVVPHI